MTTKVMREYKLVDFCSTSASTQPQDIPRVSDKLGADGVVLLPHAVSAAAGHAGLRDKLQIQ